MDSSTVLAVLMLSSALVLGVVALRLARRRLPGAVAPLILSHGHRVGTVVFMLGAIATWTGGYALSLLAAGSEATIWLHRIAFLGVAATPPGVLAVVLDLSGWHWRTPRGVAAVFAIPALTMILALTSDFQVLLWESVVAQRVGALMAAHTKPAIWFWVHTVFSYGALASAFLLLMREYARAPKKYARERMEIGLAFLAPWAVNASYVALDFPIALDPTPMGMLVTATLFYRVLRSVHLVDLLPVAWNTVVEIIDDPVVVVDAEARVVDANPAAKQLLGDEASGPDGFQSELVRFLQEERPVGPMTVGAETRRSRRYDVRVSSVPLLDSSVRLRAVVMRDVTEQVRKEEQEREAQRQLHHTQRLESIGVLAGGIAHDFNNMLATIMGSVELALAELPPGHPASGSLELAIDGSVRAAELTRELLAYAGKGRVATQTLDLTDCIREIEPLAIASLSKNVKLRTRFLSGSAFIQGDSTQIRQVAMNLILNAAEAHAGGPGVVTTTVGVTDVGEEEISTYIAADRLVPGRHAYLEVADKGCGLDDEEQRRMFDPFYTTKTAGRGLGLSSVLGIVRNHQGAIALISAPGEGTSIRVMLPFVEDSTVSNGQRDEASAGTRVGCVLVVDDDSAVLSVAKATLASLGYSVATAAGGEEALEKVRVGSGEIDVVLLDMTMPGLSGEAVLHRLRVLHPELPIVLTSGYTEADVAGSLNSDSTSFLGKPYTRRALATAIEGALRYAESSESPRASKTSNVPPRAMRPSGRKQ